MSSRDRKLRACEPHLTSESSVSRSVSTAYHVCSNLQHQTFEVSGIINDETLVWYEKCQFL